MAKSLVEKIVALDLEPIVVQIIKRRKWKKERAEKAALKYRRFLYLLCKYPYINIASWSCDLTALWREHILDTRKYHTDCNGLIGHYIHHYPINTQTPEAETRARRNTSDMFRLAFLPEEPSTDPLMVQLSTGAADSAALVPLPKQNPDQ